MSMKSAVLALLALACRPARAGHGALAGLESKQWPGGAEAAVTAVTQLMRDWSMRLEVQGKTELSSYDKYACWCEDTLARKAADISSAKEQIDSLQKQIEKLAGEIASHGAEVAHLKQLIADNKQEQREATDVRRGENGDYEGQKTEAEQCIGALEAAIRALSGAGEGKEGFLQTIEQAQLISVAGGVQKVLRKASPSGRVSKEDLDVVRSFFAEPSRMFSRARGASLLAVNHNPFGDYAPQSTRIQGVLKSLYDSFTSDLEKANVEEADSQKSFEELMATKEAELATLEATLEQQELAMGSKTKAHAESKVLRSDTQKQLKADEAFFATTKAGCEQKAVEWGERVRLRTEELQGIGKAIEILSSEESSAIFHNSSAQLVQLSSKVRSPRLVALQTLAKRSGSKALARIAAQVQAGGYFDKVIGEVDEMIALLRREEKMDIEHRDRCQNSQNANSNSVEDLNSDITKAGEEIERMTHEQSKVRSEITELETEIAKTESDMEQALAMRNKERRSFEKSVEDDTAAIAIVKKAQAALVAFYERNKIPMLVQRNSTGKEYTIDPDKAPEVVWDAGGAGYIGAKDENTGVVAILAMVIEDVEKEIGESRQDDADAQAAYEKGRAAMEEALAAATESKVALEKRLVELDGKIQDTQDHKDAKAGDLSAQNELTTAIYSDCSWVETHFQSRADNRKKEMDGLFAAKAYLAGVSDGSELAP